MDTVMNANLRHVDPAEVDGPSPEYYRELAEETGAEPLHLVALCHSNAWACARCGGPNICPSLEATLRYRCGYGEIPGGLWVHQ